MTLATRIRQALAPIPAGALVPRDWVLSLLEEDDGSDDVDLTVEDVATLLSRAPSTVRTWAAAGRFPNAYRLHGREWRIPRADLRALRTHEASARESTDAETDLGAWRRVVRR